MIQISIIIATFNASQTLRRCLNSIISQLTSECELIVIDGGSKDNTNEIISSYGNSIAYTISELDKGVYDAWNKGICNANGKWIAFIGADDVLLPNAIEAYINTIKNTRDVDSYDYICAVNEYVDKEGNIMKIMGGEPKWNVFRKRMNAAHVASLHNKKNLFDKLGGYDLNFRICADYELLMRKKEKLKYLFMHEHIARMQVGGMSFSVRAIKETYNIRAKHDSVSKVYNTFLYIRDRLIFSLFIVRKRLMGYNMSE